ncbi:Wzz/FepE/Etk N-terminal domain-containing protein [Vibrio campbellii]|uniref:Wzz/FepE/Etk N-terminal domain-containing protein n=1 Tax=Vibrio campbellii TaxID=680 RepID=UPI0009C17526|nr:Wzz/FepE/Etk N-terminal domain-containing protein [Vibrio campbellii]AUW03269.1 LPS O-antigen length regulator [Vibrio campbellii]OQQ00384.1 LPS O-antigen length regulator [Vibrio campbellii]
MDIDRISNLTPPSFHSDNEKFDIRELIKAFWRDKWLVVAITTLFALGAVLYSLSLPNIYRTDALLTSSESSDSGNLSKMAGQLGGLAALAGVNLGASESSQTELAIQVLKSRKFVDSFVTRHDLVVPLMAAKGWDLNSDTLIIDDEIYDASSKTWLREPRGLIGKEPTAQEIYKYFTTQVLSISEDADTGMYMLSVKHYSPYLAKKWADWLIADINLVMRERKISEVTKNLNYLNAQLSKTAVTDMQTTFYKLIEEQTKSLMLAQVQDEFVFKVIDPAVVPEKKFEPRRALICVLGTLIGGILSVLIVLIRFSWRKNINHQDLNANNKAGNENLS